MHVYDVCRYIPGEDLDAALETLIQGLAGDPAMVRKRFECSKAIYKQVLIVSLFSCSLCFTRAGLASHCCVWMPHCLNMQCADPCINTPDDVDFAPVIQFD